MAPAGAFQNFRLGPGGATTWIHVISGKKVCPLISSAPLKQELAPTLLCYNCTITYSNVARFLRGKQSQRLQLLPCAADFHTDSQHHS